jgi:hypothetical protein
MFFARACVVATLITAASTTAAFADIDQAALNRECNYPPYARRLAGVEVQAYAEIARAATARAARDALAELAGVEAGAAPLTVQARLDLKRTVVGGFAAAAFQEVGDNYFCRLEQAYPQRLDAINAAEAHYQVAISRIFEPVLYTPTPEMYREKRAMAQELDEAARALEHPFTRAEILAALARAEYSERLTGRFMIEATMGPSSGGVCTGASMQSLVIVDTRVLNQLNELRSWIASLLSGQGVILNARMQTLAQALYGPEAARMNLSDDAALCLRHVADEVRAVIDDVESRENAAAPAATDATQASPETPGGTATPTPTPPSPPATPQPETPAAGGNSGGGGK